MIGGTTPTFQIMRGVVMGRGLNCYTYNGGSYMEKKFKKNLENIIFMFYLWWVGGFVYIRRDF
jgi:hypothetical protein